jgi:two-component system chemotaxis response regulator CheB
MAERKVIAVGASAGGLEALLKIVRDLPSDLPAAVLVVVHYAPDFPSTLPKILARSGTLRAAHPSDGDVLRSGHIYVAPPNRHLAVQDGVVRVHFSPRVNGFRPAIDPLFRSVVEEYRSGTIGVLLSGGMTDGVAGLLAIKQAGGLAVIQDPRDAVVPSLPQNARAVVAVDHIVPASEMGKLLGQLALAPVQTGTKAMPDSLIRAGEATREDFAAQQQGERAGQVSLFSCPHCVGVMRQTDETRLAEFLCHVGHSFEGESLLSAQSETIETIAWSLLRALKERALLARELAALAHNRGDVDVEARLSSVAEAADSHIAFVEGSLLNDPVG